MAFETKVTPVMEDLAGLCREHTGIPGELYEKYDIKKGLRDINGHGVRAGLTNISNVQAFEKD